MWGGEARTRRARIAAGECVGFGDQIRKYTVPVEKLAEESPTGADPSEQVYGKHATLFAGRQTRQGLRVPDSDGSSIHDKYFLIVASIDILLSVAFATWRLITGPTPVWFTWLPSHWLMSKHLREPSLRLHDRLIRLAKHEPG
jgi:hypothetical protein